MSGLAGGLPGRLSGGGLQGAEAGAGAGGGGGGGSGYRVSMTLEEKEEIQMREAARAELKGKIVEMKEQVDKVQVGD